MNIHRVADVGDTALRRCRLCDNTALAGALFCPRCVEMARRSATCPECDSSVTVAVRENSPLLEAFVEHDDSCPAYAAIVAPQHD
jgi:hypothetical protein